MAAPFRMYTDLAAWWPLLSPPSAYAEEVAELLPILLGAPDRVPVTMLELGSGGGSFAFHMKAHVRLTLSDLASAMLAVSRVTNPECEHIEGDMRALDLGRTFDLVLVHDAIVFATTPADARAVLGTAARHCRTGGGLVVIPDFVTETFEADENSGGSTMPDGRALRYTERKQDQDPADAIYETVYDFVVRDAGGQEEAVHEVHCHGLFPRASWLAWLDHAGFDAWSRPDPWGRDVFSARKRAS